MNGSGQRWRIFAAITTAISGAVLGAAAQEVLHSNLRLAAVSVVVLCLTLIAVLTALLSIERTAQDGRRTASTELELNRQQLAELVARLEKQVGVQIECQLVDDLNKKLSCEGDLVVQAIERARNEVLVMDLILEDGRRPDLPMRQDLMSGHLEKLLECAQSGVTYKRICQTDSLGNPFAGLGEEAFLKHCAVMCELREARNAATMLKVAAKRYPYKFVIIDRKCLVLQLHAYQNASQGSPSQYIWCELLVKDPGQDLISVFVGMWDDLFDGETSRTVTRKQVPYQDCIDAADN